MIELFDGLLRKVGFVQSVLFVLYFLGIVWLSGFGDSSVLFFLTGLVFLLLILVNAVYLFLFLFFKHKTNAFEKTLNDLSSFLKDEDSGLNGKV